MKKILSFILGIATIFSIVSCSESLESGGFAPSGNDSIDAEPGVVTAGEWNDLDNWDFWLDLNSSGEYGEMKSYWSWYTNNRITIKVLNDDDSPAINRKVKLLINDSEVWSCRTNNQGIAHLWVSLEQESNNVDNSKLSITIDDSAISSTIQFYGSEEVINEVKVTSSTVANNKVQVAFMVDATGSMGDEMEFLKKDLEDVINKVFKNNSSLDIKTAALFYRDAQDEYLTRLSDFSDIQNTIQFIVQQNANGGGDYEEAVDTALEESINKLSWDDDARCRILFTLLDAPPHYSSAVISKMHKNTKLAAEKGVTIIPISASGINKFCEFLLRNMAITTGGTYTFITGHSGVGSGHIEPSVGDYEVEKLNDLLVRIIDEYSR